jgi:hypothetical protein
MLIAETTKQPKDFPSIPTKNDYDLAQAIINSGFAKSTDITLCNNVITAYNNLTTITYKTYNTLIFLFDLYIGNSVLYTLR